MEEEKATLEDKKEPEKVFFKSSGFA